MGTGTDQVTANRRNFGARSKRCFQADGSFTWQIVWSDEPTISARAKSRQEASAGPLQVLGWMSCGRRVFAPVVNFSGRGAVDLGVRTRA